MYWRNDVTSTCLICLIWINCSRCTCLPNLVIIGLWNFGNGCINFYINSYIITSEKAELTASIRHIERFLKSEIPIYNSQVPDTAATKTRRTQTIAKRYLLHWNAKTRFNIHFYKNFDDFKDERFNRQTRIKGSTKRWRRF